MYNQEKTGLLIELGGKRRMLTVSAMAALALSGSLLASKPARAQHQSTTSDFMIAAWGPCPENVNPELSLGVNTFVGAEPDQYRPDCTEDAVAQAVNGRADVINFLQQDSSGQYDQMPDAEPSQTGVINPDEADAHMGADKLATPAQLPLNGKIDMLNLTDGCFNSAEDCSKFFLKTNYLTTDFYPYEGDGCSQYANKNFTSVGEVYIIQKAVAASGLPNLQWLEVNAVNGSCKDASGSIYRLTPPIVQAEAMETLEAGATGLGWFFPAGVDENGNFFGHYLPYEIAPDIQAAVRTINQQAKDTLWPILQGTDLNINPLSENDPIKTAGRQANGQDYILATNSTNTNATFSRTLPNLPAGAKITETDLTIGANGAPKTLSAGKGSMVTDNIEAYGTHLYQWTPESPTIKPKPKKAPSVKTKVIKHNTSKRPAVKTSKRNVVSAKR